MRVRTTASGGGFTLPLPPPGDPQASRVRKNPRPQGQNRHNVLKTPMQMVVFPLGVQLLKKALGFRALASYAPHLLTPKSDILPLGCRVFATFGVPQGVLAPAALAWPAGKTLNPKPYMRKSPIP